MVESLSTSNVFDKRRSLWWTTSTLPQTGAMVTASHLPRRRLLPVQRFKLLDGRVGGGAHGAAFLLLPFIWTSNLLPTPRHHTALTPHAPAHFAGCSGFRAKTLLAAGRGLPVRACNRIDADDVGAGSSVLGGLAFNDSIA